MYFVVFGVGAVAGSIVTLMVVALCSIAKRSDGSAAYIMYRGEQHGND